VDVPVTRDALFGGALSLTQPAAGHGYRTNIDALLLAAFAAGRRPARLAVDLGAGVGAVALGLLHLGLAQKVALVEKDPALATISETNLRDNRLELRAIVHRADLCRGLAETVPQIVHTADLVVANPPYVSPERDGGIRRSQVGTSRSQSRVGNVSPFVRAAADALGHRGRACFVYPAHALLDLLVLGRASGLEPKRLRLVHGKSDRPARIALVEFVAGRAGGLVVLPPLVETVPDGTRSAEIADLLRAKRAKQPIDDDRERSTNAQVVVAGRTAAIDGRQKHVGGVDHLAGQPPSGAKQKKR
jgi:tRNA1Val (adenine37-N6)-methyltransferase